jgi:uncharacterized membrane protein YbaN (DUF454 family)
MSADCHPHSRLMRSLFWLAGTLALGLGVLGAFLPILPTTPFVLLAAACYVRCSPRFHRWLLRQPFFGTVIRDWQRQRAIPRRARRLALLMMAVSFAFSIWNLREHAWLQWVLVLLRAGWCACRCATENRFTICCTRVILR